jgi:hypothetical protein
MDDTSHPEPESPRTDSASRDIRPVVIVAPELRGRRDSVVIREQDDTDADYQSRCDLVALLLNHAEKD